MKAGVYKTPNGNLIYVAKDRTIKAASHGKARAVGVKVSHRSSDDTVHVPGTDYRCRRVSDVPNGCTDPEKVIAWEVYREAYPGKFDAVPSNGGVVNLKPNIVNNAITINAKSARSAPLPAKLLLVDEYPKIDKAAMIASLAGAVKTQTGASGSGVLLVGDNVAITEQTMRDAGYRVCHRQSARKHRRKRREVVYVPSLDAFAWRARA